MKDLLTTTSSVIVILFCISILFLVDNEETALQEQDLEMISAHNGKEFLKAPHPLAKTTLFHRVQSVRLKEGVLIFVTADQDGLKEHFFVIRDKNVILVKKDAGDMPPNSIKFASDGHGTLMVTIPNTFELDPMQDLLSCRN
ncbi:hypothetical protein [uncultured Gimesia sp.]|uniref:hypothetical protein n=1 Tax=uncultured Gimesia sp. TaxID=1678688 RepID=UPI0030DD94F8